MMFSFSVTEQVITFCRSIGFGVLLCVFYSLTDVAVSLFFKGKRKTQICDVIAAIFGAVAFFCFSLAYNLGKFRFYTFFGAALGFTAGFTSFSFYIISYGEKLTGALKSALSSLFRPLTRSAQKLKTHFACIVGKRKERRREKNENRKKKPKKKMKKSPESIAKGNNDVV